MRSVGGVFISLTVCKPIVSEQFLGGKLLQSAIHGYYHAKVTVTFLDAQHQRFMTYTKLYCLMIEARI